MTVFPSPVREDHEEVLVETDTCEIDLERKRTQDACLQHGVDNVAILDIPNSRKHRRPGVPRRDPCRLGRCEFL